MNYVTGAVDFPKDNLYRRLGTRSDLSQERIREKYVQKLREFPPETHPEQFQKIREAYEILSNPQTRAEYDAARQGKPSWGELLTAGGQAYKNKDYDRAGDCFKSALEIEKTIDLCMLVARCYLFGQGDEERFLVYANQAMEVAEDDSERCLVESEIAVYKINFNQFHAGLKLSYQIAEKYPRQKDDLYFILSHLVPEAEDPERANLAYEFIEHLLPEKGQESAEDLELFKWFLETISEARRWDRKSMIVSRLKSLARSLKKEEDIERAKIIFETEFDEYEQVGRFREAELAVAFLLGLDKKDADYRQWNASIKEKVTVEKAYKRLLMDPSIFPGVSTFVAYWFYDHYLPDMEMPEELEIMTDMNEQMESLSLSEVEYKQLLTFGLHQLRKEYPQIHKAFKEDWGDLLEECQEGLSRRVRRALR